MSGTPNWMLLHVYLIEYYFMNNFYHFKTS